MADRQPADPVKTPTASPLQLIVAGIIGAAIFVGTLVLLARFIAG